MDLLGGFKYFPNIRFQDFQDFSKIGETSEPYKISKHGARILKIKPKEIKPEAPSKGL